MGAIIFCHLSVRQQRSQYIGQCRPSCGQEETIKFHKDVQRASHDIEEKKIRKEKSIVEYCRKRAGEFDYEEVSDRWAGTIRACVLGIGIILK